MCTYREIAVDEMRAAMQLWCRRPIFMGGPRLHDAACLIFGVAKSRNIAPSEKGRGRLAGSRPTQRGAKRPVEDRGVVHPMPARRSTNRFHERELARALRAAAKSGTAIDRVDVDPATGKISVIIAKPADGDKAKTSNEVEDWITKHADKR
jgi:hypothetical protein